MLKIWGCYVLAVNLIEQCWEMNEDMTLRSHFWVYVNKKKRDEVGWGNLSSSKCKKNG